MPKTDTNFCNSCRKSKPDVEKRYSFGFYAGKLCNACAFAKFRDHCGLATPQGGEGKQGDPTELDEYLIGGPDAIWGED